MPYRTLGRSPPPGQARRPKVDFCAKAGLYKHNTTTVTFSGKKTSLREVNFSNVRRITFGNDTLSFFGYRDIVDL